MSAALEAARIRYIAERSSFEEAARIIAASIEEELIEKQIHGVTSYRAKTVSSFVKKALVKDYADPWGEVTDKAGVRVVFDRPSSLDAGLEVIRDLFPEATVEDGRLLEGEEDRLKYPKVHAQVSLPSGVDGVDGIACEVQLRTAAQDLWSKMSHALLYKPMAPPAPDVRRSLYRLLALVELYDSEVERGMTAMASNPAYKESQLLQEAESAFHSFVASDYQLELSQEIIPVLSTLIDVAMPTYREKLAAFIGQNREKLADFYVDYGPESESGRQGFFPLASQPESIVIVERLGCVPELLRSRWDSVLPPDWLTDLAAIWGVEI